MAEINNPKQIWPCLNYRDARGAIAFLNDAFGFETRACHEANGRVQHAELRFPEGGGVMLGTADPDGTEFKRLPVGAACLYVVTDQPDALHARAVAAGAEIIRPLTDQDYGSREFSARDPEGNLWSFGTYRGE